MNTDAPTAPRSVKLIGSPPPMPPVPPIKYKTACIQECGGGYIVSLSRRPMNDDRGYDSRHVFTDLPSAMSFAQHKLAPN